MSGNLDAVWSNRARPDREDCIGMTPSLGIEAQAVLT